jgi:hypothetical protein
MAEHAERRIARPYWSPAERVSPNTPQAVVARHGAAGARAHRIGLT